MFVRQNISWNYGNDELPLPNYDIIQFKKDVPKQRLFLKLGNEFMIPQVEAKVKEPTSNMTLLWIVMGVVILLFGDFFIEDVKGELTTIMVFYMWITQ